MAVVQQGHAGEKGLGGKFGHPCPSGASLVRERERPRRLLGIATGTEPVDEATAHKAARWPFLGGLVL